MIAVRLDVHSREIRQQLGPVPWFVLEELLLVEDGRTEAGTLLVPASVRSLAAAVSLNKDTVSRALRRLEEACVVTALPHPTSRRGFGAGSYAVGPVRGLRRLLIDPQPTSRTRPRPSTKLATPAYEPAQLTLLDAVTDDDPSGAHRLPLRPPMPDDTLAPGVRGEAHERPQAVHESPHEPGAGSC